MRFLPFLLILSGSAHATVFFGALAYHKPQDYAVTVPVDVNFELPKAELSLVEMIKTEVHEDILKIAGSGTVLLVQEPLEESERFSFSRPRNYEKFDLHLKFKLDGAWVAFANRSTRGAGKALQSFSVELSGEKGVYLRLDNLPGDRLRLNSKSGSPEADTELRSIIIDRFRKARMISLNEDLKVRLRLRGHVSSVNWDLSKDDLLNFLGLRGARRWIFSCQRSLRNRD